MQDLADDSVNAVMVLIKTATHGFIHNESRKAVVARYMEADLMSEDFDDRDMIRGDLRRHTIEILKAFIIIYFGFVPASFFDAGVTFEPSVNPKEHCWVTNDDTNDV